MNISDKDPNKLLPVVLESLKFSGFDVIKPFIIFSTIILSEEDLTKSFERYKSVLAQIK